MPRSADSVRTCPARSDREKSGAATGASSQVSIVAGNVSVSCGRADARRLRNDAGVLVVLNGSTRRASDPSSTQILWLCGRSGTSCTKPLGQRIDARHGAFGLSESEEYFLAVLRKESGSGLQHARLTSRFRFHGNRRTDGVTIALRAAQAERNRRRQILHHVLQKAQLWGVAVFQKHFLPAILIEVGESKRSAILEKVQPHRAGNVGKCSIPIIRVKNIALEAAPGAVGPNEFVDGTPSLLVIMGGLWPDPANWQPLAARKNCSGLRASPGNHAIRNVEIGKAVVIEIKSVARPRPAAYPDSGRSRSYPQIRASLRPAVAQQRIAHGVFPVERPNFLRGAPS